MLGNLFAQPLTKSLSATSFHAIFGLLQGLTLSTS